MLFPAYNFLNCEPKDVTTDDQHYMGCIGQLTFNDLMGSTIMYCLPMVQFHDYDNMSSIIMLFLYCLLVFFRMQGRGGRQWPTQKFHNFRNT